MPRVEYLAEFEILVMAAIARLGADAYGMTIRREIEERGGRVVAIGAVYTSMERLRAKGYVTFHVSAPRPVQGGRARKHVHLTTSGRHALLETSQRLRRLLPTSLPDPVRENR